MTKSHNDHTIGLVYDGEAYRECDCEMPEGVYLNGELITQSCQSDTLETLLKHLGYDVYRIDARFDHRRRIENQLPGNLIDLPRDRIKSEYKL